ncbi:hypothetical protein SAMN04488693_101512 [Arthrobacter subterraneus]|uniref:Uncharacterized protein n=1 Tax=Arthrobacter subterraneus TaxID=335973 RepID=A0A1G8D7W8_9MICC|nr:hypothetical protein [Arthrobacter subterraneus]SDH53832.1 hypothetical protein SAMN04488693_101512 [Arthrobacter subterraneus]
MTEQRQYDGGAGTAHSSPVQQPGRSETPADPSSSAGPEAVAGPFTLRETVIGVSVLVMFTGTILPFVDGVNLWRAFPLFFLGIGILLPVAALALLIGRRSGARHLRVGSLSVDQFASVTAAFAAAFFFLQTVTIFGIGSFIALLGAVGFLVATVGGPHLGVFKSDFTGRPSSSAHPIAREALPARPRPPKADTAEKAGGWKNFRPGSKAAPASDGPNSTGRSAGYAVAGYAAGQGAGNQQVPFSAGQGNAEGSAQAAPAAREPAATKATAVQPTPAQRSDAERSDTQVSAAQPSGAQADAGRAEATQPAATAAQPKVEAAEPAASEPENADAQASHPRTESISATRDAEDEEPVLEAFWFAVGTPRSVVDEQTGAQLFVLQPGDWEVGIEDRGHEFLVQDKRTGRIGVMRDLRNIERAPREG